METVISIFLTILGIYVLIGLLFSVYFFLKGASRLDHGIAESKWTVRLLLVPGAIGLWPVLLFKLFKRRS